MSVRDPIQPFDNRRILASCMTKSKLISALLGGIIVALAFNKFVVIPFMPWWIGLISAPILVIATLGIVKAVSSLNRDDA